MKAKKDNMIWIRRMLVSIVFLIFVYFLTRCANAEQNAPPLEGGDSVGDWIIENTDEITRLDQEIRLKGNLTIEDGGKLTFKNVTLKMNCSKDGEFHIEVQEGGEFYIYDNDNNNETTFDVSNITAYDQEFEYMFYVKNGAKMEMKYSELHECGFHFKNRGLTLESDNVIIENSYFSNNWAGIFCNNVNLRIENNTFSNNRDGIYCEYGTIEIVNNYLINNLGSGIGFSDGNVTIKNCIISDNGAYGIGCGNSDPLVINCTILNNRFGFYSWKCNYTIKNIIIKGSTDRDFDCWNGNVSIFNSTIENSGTYVFFLNDDSHAITINTTFNKNKIPFFDSKSNLTVKWFLKIKVEDPQYKPMADVSIRVQDNENGTYEENYKTNKDGWVKWIEFMEYIQDENNKIYYTPHTINITKEKDSTEFIKTINESLLIYINLGKDIIPPEIYNIEYNVVDGKSVFINWSTNEESDSLIKYGLDENYGFEKYNPQMTKIHSILITDLNPDTTYHFSINCTDAKDNSNQSKDYSFKTKDTIPPKNPTFNPKNGEIINTKTPKITIIFDEEVEITLATLNDKSILNILQTSDNKTFRFEPTYDLLEGGNTISVKAKDLNGNEMIEPATSSFTINTTQKDKIPPEITNVTTNKITQNTVTITWNTDESSTSQIEYGITNSYGKETTKDENLVTFHSVTINGLESNTNYHFRVKSEDKNNNMNVSGDYTFKTSEKPALLKPNITINMDIDKTEPREDEQIKITMKITNNDDNTIIVEIILTDNGKELKNEKNTEIGASKTLEFTHVWYINGIGNHTIKVVVIYDGKEVKNTTKEINVIEKDSNGGSFFKIIYLIPILLILIGIIVSLIIRQKRQSSLQGLQQKPSSIPSQQTFQILPKEQNQQPITQQPQNISEIEWAHYKICPYCSAKVPKEFSFCNMCGKKLI